MRWSPGVTGTRVIAVPSDGTPHMTPIGWSDNARHDANDTGGDMR